MWKKLCNIHRKWCLDSAPKWLHNDSTKKELYSVLEYNIVHAPLLRPHMFLFLAGLSGDLIALDAAVVFTSLQ